MSAAAATSAPTLPAPDPSGASRPRRFGCLLDLVRRVIDYGRELAATLQRRGANTDLTDTVRAFGTADIGRILARITQGLQRAGILEQRLIRCPDPPTPPLRAPAARAPRATAPTAPRPAAPADAPARLPTAEWIAVHARRQPLGVVLADICRDLGIMPSNPLWQELSSAIIRYGGNLARLFNDVLALARATRYLDLPPALRPAPAAPPCISATGPPK